MFKFFTIKNAGIFEVNKNENTNSRSIGEIRFACSDPKKLDFFETT